jgi:cobalt-precorrin-7 (C5)-methyltransferase
MTLRIVGVGVRKGQLTEEAKEALSRADEVHGSRRALELAGVDGIHMRTFGHEAYRGIEEQAKAKEVVVLSTGDPMVCGLGTRMQGEVVPGISSVQMALARLRRDLASVIVVDAHGREAYAEIEELAEHRDVLVMADRKFDPSILPGRRMVILEDLGGPEERMTDTGPVTSDRAIVLIGASPARA